MSQTRSEWLAEKLAAFEDWAEQVQPEELTEADPERSREIIKQLADDPDADRLIEQAGRVALQERRESA